MRQTVIWIGALLVGAVLGFLGMEWLDALMNFVATVFTRLFQLLAVPTIVLAVITTFATFGSKGSGRIFSRTLLYTVLTNSVIFRFFLRILQMTDIQLFEYFVIF